MPRQRRQTQSDQPDDSTGETGSLHCSVMSRQRRQAQSDQPDDPTGETVCIVVWCQGREG